MKRKLDSINLPGESMEVVTKQAIMSVGSKEAAVADSEMNSSSSSSEQNNTKSLLDDLWVLQEGITKYSSINEHGKGVWVVGDVKKRIDDLNYRSGKKVSIRAFTNAALDFVLNTYGDELVKLFTDD